jgi:hypothetical protein
MSSNKKPAVAKPAAAKPGAVAKPAATKTGIAVKSAVAPTKTVSTTQVAAAQVAIPVEIKSIKIKQIKEVTEDVSGLQEKSNKWPLVLDTLGTAKTFFRYSDVNFINAGDVVLMQPEALRKALIGAIRFNKPFGLDLEDRSAALWKEVEKSFEMIQSGLLESLFNKKLLQDNNFLKIVKADVDGEEYSKDYNYTSISNFKLIIVTTDENVDKTFLNKFTVYKIEA